MCLLWPRLDVLINAEFSILQWGVLLSHQLLAIFIVCLEYKDKIYSFVTTEELTDQLRKFQQMGCQSRKKRNFSTHHINSLNSLNNWFSSVNISPNVNKRLEAGGRAGAVSGLMRGRWPGCHALLDFIPSYHHLLSPTAAFSCFSLPYITKSNKTTSVAYTLQMREHRILGSKTRFHSHFYHLLSLWLYL